jgi:hypothetical protein
LLKVRIGRRFAFCIVSLLKSLEVADWADAVLNAANNPKVLLLSCRSSAPLLRSAVFLLASAVFLLRNPVPPSQKPLNSVPCSFSECLAVLPTYSVVILPLPDLLSVLGGIDEVRVAVSVILLYHSLQHTISLLVQSLHVTQRVV